jgi:hypothetical protein
MFIIIYINPGFKGLNGEGIQRAMYAGSRPNLFRKD